MSETQVELHWYRLLINSIFRPVSYMVPGSRVSREIKDVSIFIVITFLFHKCILSLE